MSVCLRIQPDRKGNVDHRRGQPRNRRRHWPPSSKEPGATYRAWTLEEVAPASAGGHAARGARRSRNQPGEHFRGASPDQRAAFAHADDRGGVPPQDPPRSHGQYHQADHAGRHARRFPRGGSHQPSGHGDHPGGGFRPRQNARRYRPHRRDEPGLQVAQDQRHHQRRTPGATCRAAKFRPPPARSTAPS